MALSFIIICCIPDKYINIDEVHKRKHLEMQRRLNNSPEVGEKGGTIDNLNAIIETEQEANESFRR